MLRHVMYSPDDSTFNDDDHAYRICLIKWQWEALLPTCIQVLPWSDEIILKNYEKILMESPLIPHMCTVSHYIPPNRLILFHQTSFLKFDKEFKLASCEDSPSKGKTSANFFFFLFFVWYKKRKRKRRESWSWWHRRNKKLKTGWDRFISLAPPRLSSFFLLRKWMLQTNKRNWVLEEEEDGEKLGWWLIMKLQDIVWRCERSRRLFSLTTIKSE